MDLSQIMGKVQEMQSKMKEAQESLSAVVVEAEAGAGMVKVMMNGHKKLLKLEMDPAVPSDPEMMKDLIIAAVNQGIEKAEEASKEKMKDVTGGLMPNIPGLNNLF